MSDTYSYEVLEPGGHARLVGNVLDRISRASANPASAVGSSRAVLGDPETASWMQRTTAADGAALIESVKGNTLRWNQGVKNDAYWNDNANTTHTIAGGLITVTSTSTTTFGVYKSPSTIGDGNGLVVGHTYCGLADVNPSINASMYFGLNVSSSGTDAIVFGRAVASGVWTRIGGIVKLTATSNNGLRIAVGGNTTISAGDTFQAKNVQLFDLTSMFGAGSEPSTVAEFEALFPEPYYPYDAGSLLPVRMEGVETVGRNLLDERAIDTTIVVSSGNVIANSNSARGCTGYIKVLPNTTYTLTNPSATSIGLYCVQFFDASKTYISQALPNMDNTSTPKQFTTPADAAFVRVNVGTASIGSIQLELGSVATAHVPYWHSERTIPATGLRSAGTVYDELRADAAVTRVGAVDLGTLNWGYSESSSGNHWFLSNNTPADIKPSASNSSTANITAALAYEVKTPNQLYAGNTGIGINASTNQVIIVDPSITSIEALKASLSGKMMHYELATPTTTPIDPPIPLSYRTGAGGTERVMVAEGSMSAPPIFATRYPLDPADLAASIAPVDGPTAKTNHAVGELVMLGFTLCKVTTAIARGEAITIGTNVTRTSVATEIAALS